MKAQETCYRVVGCFHADLSDVKGIWKKVSQKARQLGRQVFVKE
jgi:predicted aconitase